jgi:heme exporter protein C
MVIAALFMVLKWVTADATNGNIQRIFYFHVPLAWVAFGSFFVVFIASIMYLVKRDLKWDYLAASSGEIGLVFTTLVLVTGSIWAKPMWGKWWIWDARLTTALILWLIYAGYFIIRSYINEDNKRARFAAIIGIVGFVDVPIVALAVAIAPGINHPPPSYIFKGGLPFEALFTLLFCITTFTLLYYLLASERLKLRQMEEEVKKLKNFVRK